MSHVFVTFNMSMVSIGRAAGDKLRGNKARPCRASEATVRTLTFAVREKESYWKVLGRCLS